MTVLAALALWRDRAVCHLKGHMWDSDRPAGPIHARDICWRCDAVNPPSATHRPRGLLT